MSSDSCRYLCIVDPRPDDYLPLSELARERGLQFRLLEDGRSALRVDPAEPVDIWMINTRLPDMTGFDLHEMLVDRLDSAFVALVDEEYSDRRERIARRSGAKLYVCKPPQLWWLDLLAHPPPKRGVSRGPLLHHISDG